ncbi:PXA domain-containing protein Pxa1 [Schizosaccharomyces pombe]|uniref:PXA domain protein 1 n=1 Tax=Schizosaccharomyces pombe (strain 972 / ATCC 24843) TaxID=284812 RepID=PXA1_SCHPO|nr:PXA domain protein Pxa1 [Schizosaccharomyces pombe]O14200.1 RecName: Full=PXA domain protein 1 [Schizosaccharomyces pombe 972h-]CAB10855.1 PXA domain protein Pxa1 [Schizosaccharomyces pombe]|eukprot:NP_593362.1 PXA domain protein Pxa1 [Schizosaccharomyces pombe]
MAKLSSLLNPIISKILEIYVYSWYSGISKDALFPSQCEQVGGSIVHELEKRLSRQDAMDLLFYEIPFLLIKHIENTEEAKLRFALPQGQILEIDTIYHSLHPHIALEKEENELVYCRLLVEDILKYLLPATNSKSEIECVILREALAVQIHKSIQVASSPETMYKFIIYLSKAILQPSRRPWKESITTAVRWVWHAFRILLITRGVPYFSTAWFQFYLKLFSQKDNVSSSDLTRWFFFYTLLYPWIALVSAFVAETMTLCCIVTIFYDKNVNRQWKQYILTSVSNMDKGNPSGGSQSTNVTTFRRFSQSSYPRRSNYRRRISTSSKSLYELSPSKFKSIPITSNPPPMLNLSKGSTSVEPTFCETNASVALSTVTSTPVFSTDSSPLSSRTRENLLSLIPSAVSSPTKANTNKSHQRSFSIPKATKDSQTPSENSAATLKQAAIDAYSQIPVIPFFLPSDKLIMLVESEYRNKHIFYSLLNSFTMVMFPELRHTK